MLTRSAIQLLNGSSLGSLNSMGPIPSSECNAFRGVYHANGSVFLGPDFSNGVYTGFSMFHACENNDMPYGAMSQMPVVGNITEPFIAQDGPAGPDERHFDHYKAMTKSNITVELAASKNAGIYQYTFPEGEIANVIVDLSHVLKPAVGDGLEYLGGSFTSLNDRQYMGFGSYITPNNTVLYLQTCAYFDSAADIIVFQSGSLETTTRDQRNQIFIIAEDPIAAVLTFTNTSVVARVGLKVLTNPTVMEFLKAPKETCDMVDNEIPEGMHISEINMMKSPKITFSSSPESTSNNTKAERPNESSDNFAEFTNDTAERFRLFVILLSITLAFVVLSFIIVCCQALSDRRKARGQNGGQMDGATDEPPRL